MRCLRVGEGGGEGEIVVIDRVKAPEYGYEK